MPTYVCSKCGGGPATVNDARPSLDDRYAVGYCPDGCTPVPVYSARLRRNVPDKRQVVALVRVDLFDRSAFDARRQREADRKLVERAIAGDARLTAEQLARASQIRARWDREAEERRGTPIAD